MPSPTPTLAPSPTPTPAPLAGLSLVHQPVPLSSDPMLPKYFYLRSGLIPNATPANVLNVNGNSINFGNNVIGWVPPNCQKQP